MPSPSTSNSSATPSRRTGVYYAAIGIVICVTLARSIWVLLYAVDIPYWDQWTQLMEQFVALKQGAWHLSNYFAPHSEHRILFTRLISMALFELNGGAWSNLVEAFVNTLIYGVVLAFFYAMACRGACRQTRWILFFAVIALSALPFDWENTLVGFQNQFYILIGFALIMASVASYRTPSVSTLLILFALAIASLFTMASGLLATLAVCAALALRCWREEVPGKYTLALFVAMAVAAVYGFWLIPAAQGNAIYKAQGISEHLYALATVLAWPLQPFLNKRSLWATVSWLPTIIWLVKFARSKRAANNEIFLVSITMWVGCQALAIAHARGHGITEISSRYMNITTIGLLANFALALQLIGFEQPRSVAKYGRIGAVAICAAYVALLFARRTPNDLFVMHQRYDFARVETYYTQGYLRTNDPAYLQHPGQTIPFPNQQLLQSYLDSPIVRDLLPPTLQVKATSDDVHSGWLARIAEWLQQKVRNGAASVSWTTTSVFFVKLTSPPVLDPTTQPMDTCTLGASVNDSEFSGDIRAKIGDPIQFYGSLSNSYSSVTKRFAVVLIGSNQYSLEADPALNFRDIASQLWTKHSQPQTFAYRKVGVLADMQPGSYGIRLMTPYPDSRTICVLPYKLVIVPPAS
jgi:hypothetical protein